MSDDEPKKVTGYVVGYGKPPLEHRFKKGQSGNPKGRPKGKANQKPLLRSSDRPTQDMLLDEAYRPVLVREGENVIELPAIQAVFRAMGVAAMKGNRFAQKTLADLVQKVEQDHRDIQYANMEAFTDYKIKWNQEIERCKQLGLPDPQPLPHPDDVLIDYRKGTFRIAGPITKEEKARWDTLIERREDAQEEVTYFRQMMVEEPDRLEFWREQLMFEQRIFDMINEKLPERYQAKLEGRIYGDGGTVANDDSEEEAA
jgi:hypothetical protein